jgi:hypothetical protein
MLMHPPRLFPTIRCTPVQTGTCHQKDIRINLGFAPIYCSNLLSVATWKVSSELCVSMPNCHHTASSSPTLYPCLLRATCRACTCPRICKTCCQYSTAPVTSMVTTRQTCFIEVAGPLNTSSRQNLHAGPHLLRGELATFSADSSAVVAHG